MPAAILSEWMHTPPAREVPGAIRVSEVLSALSHALDLTEGQAAGHAVRSCVIGMHLAAEIGLDAKRCGDLYYALLMKDAGCSSNASRLAQMLGSDDVMAKRDVKTVDWTRIGRESIAWALSHVKKGAPFPERARALFEMALNEKRSARELVSIRCERGASIARRIGLSETAAEAIYSLDELWAGCGHPRGLRGEEIPLLSRIMNLAQNVDVFHTKHGRTAALAMARKRSGRWFDPRLVDALGSVAKRGAMWNDLREAGRRVTGMEPVSAALPATEETIENICIAFSEVIDAKSPYTFWHSAGVADTAVRMAHAMSLRKAEITLIRRAALLHDIGKLGVSSRILDKPDKLTPAEWMVVRRHPHYSGSILRRVPGFAEVSELAASHHEKLDGSGYFRNLTADQLPLPARILAVADIYDALSNERPYRQALPAGKVLETISKDAPRALDADCVEALKRSVAY
ncbi:MAG TPA: HD domain-containing phosphohydrolase [Bryobacteraceae bacterium]|nr:HD domain-containing phosphohydrolase [Bryobacteraceae bacterium]